MQVARLPDRLSAEIALLRSHGAAESNSDRLRRANETVDLMRSMFGRFGITRLAEVTGLDRIGIPVWMAVRPNAKTLAVSQGKGLSTEAAQASAVMEAAEIATAEDCPIPVRMSSMAELAAHGERALPFNNLLSRGEKPIADTEVQAWVEGFDLLRGSTAWVPADLVTLDAIGKSGKPSRYWQTSDGLASGNFLLEAVVHGLLERVERDAGALWNLRSDADVHARCVDPRRLEDEAVNALADQIAKAGFQLRLFDITSDIGVPVYFSTVAPSPNGRADLWKHFDLSSGMGAHPSPARAAVRAITEAAQSRVTSITGARDDFDPRLYGRQLKADLTTYVEATPHAGPLTDLADVPSSEGNLHFILERLVRSGICTAIAVPLAYEEEGPGFAAARVLVPELENPPGNRRQRFGKRALKAMMGSR
jgi:ribosomal protein S12 methylthiotransferase accessory factor